MRSNKSIRHSLFGPMRAALAALLACGGTTTASAAPVTPADAILAARAAMELEALAGVTPYHALDGSVVAYELLFERSGGDLDDGYHPVLDPGADLFGQLSDCPGFADNFNSPRFSDAFQTIVVSATFDRGPVLYRHRGLPQSAKLKRLAYDYLDEVAYGNEIVSWIPLYFKPGYLFLAGRADSGEMFLFSPDERIVRINSLADVEYVQAATPIIGGNNAHAKWTDLLSGGAPPPSDPGDDASYQIPGTEAVRDVFYNRAAYWQKDDYPYLYEDGHFGGCCHSNCGLQLALYYDNHNHENLVRDPDDEEFNRLLAMSKLVYEAYAPGQPQAPAFRDFANGEGYYFTYYYDYYPYRDDIIYELETNRPIQYLIFSDDEVVVNGWSFDAFAHSVLAVGYTEVGADFTVTLYWGWGSFPEVEFEFGSEFSEQFENQYMILNYPPKNPNPSWIVINEVFADPSSGLFGDANKDGVRHASHDEFVELFNTGVMDMDLSGWSLGDDDDDPFVFPPGTSIPPDGRLTLFGGGDPSLVPGAVFTAGGKIGNGLTNAGDTVLLRDAQGGLIDSYTYPFGNVRGDRDMSMIRDPDGYGDWRNAVRWVDPFYSPGRLNRSDVVLPGLVLNEVLADPPAGPEGDANGDGVRHMYEDELVEIMSLEERKQIDISYWCITDDDPSLSTFRFPAGTVLDPGQFATVFGGGDPQGIDGLVFASSGRISNGLANGGDRVMLTTQDFEVVSSLRWPKNPVYGDRDRSMIRVPDGVGDWRLPLGGEPIYSPNEENVDLLDVAEVVLNEVLSDPPPGLEGDANGDGNRNSAADEFVEIYNYGSEDADLWGYELKDASGTIFSIPEGVIVPPGGFLTIFGGGVPNGIPGIVITVGGAIGDGLSNTRDRVVLMDRYENVVDQVQWPRAGCRGNINVSMVRVPDFFGDWQNSLPPLPAFSPGEANSD